jgi:hypothetical protein
MAVIPFPPARNISLDKMNFFVDADQRHGVSRKGSFAASCELAENRTLQAVRSAVEQGS